MGGTRSGTAFDKRNILLESAFFDTGSIRKTAKKYNIVNNAKLKIERRNNPI